MLLTNFGSTCYMNCVLQLLFNNFYFMDYIKNADYPEESLLNSFKKISNNDSLRDFLNKMQSKLGDKMILNRQNDANETYTKVLELFENEDKECTGCFVGIHKKIYRCCKCDHKREVKENFTAINLYITDESTNLQSSLMSSLSKEILEDVECENCKNRTRTEVKNKISRWPKNLIFSINRFNSTSKINDGFDYTRNIDLCISGKSSKYTLSGVINHIGTIDCGHYTYIKITRNSITEINDDKVRQLDTFKSSSNYMLIYTQLN